ncbi:uncharacterized protein BDCG_16339 [Blastomyces dermatitidis ER-3]|uniref:Uncharacterized protein n=1 Tax=Ajellomyces dermatitidis (strain ER-3 / ATCC MYA-2586) TaxID=559297 RepID=A0ABX2VRH2_AJEDR|nr:uncharacterized protein BDCG_16339 [Blastomyces dermatitidis ER-3]OAS99826.1 hypothetical protein BDCG_16339 [Blastomyces dermatitidis ER-3]
MTTVKFDPGLRHGHTTLISADEDQTYEDFYTQLQTMNDYLIKLKNIQNSDRRHYTSATYTPVLRNNNDADAMN